MHVQADRLAAFERARHSSRTWRGTPTPIVSARITSSAPAAAMRWACSITRPGSTWPSNGQPNATLIVAVTFSSVARDDLLGVRAASSTVVFWLRCANVSVTGYATWISVVEVGQRALEPLAVEHEAGVGRRRRLGQRGEDLLGARHLRDELRMHEARGLDAPRPVAAKRVHSSARTAGSRVTLSFCRPSRGPTSQTLTCTCGLFRTPDHFRRATRVLD